MRNLPRGLAGCAEEQMPKNTASYLALLPYVCILGNRLLVAVRREDSCHRYTSWAEFSGATLIFLMQKLKSRGKACPTSSTHSQGFSFLADRVFHALIKDSVPVMLHLGSPVACPLQVEILGILALWSLP